MPRPDGSAAKGPAPTFARAVFVLFALSGFAGIIYESIWSHYLKLFLGHAAYAQTIVLVMFMGGMAIGAWLASRIDVRIYDLLKIYIAVELAIGLGGLVFHDVYASVTAFAYANVFPALGEPVSVEAAKTLLAALLILPQSVLLGATFPLMTVGIVQRRLETPGTTIAGLYFVNSLGAALGILVSGFVLLAWIGLPGAMRFAGVLNFLIAGLLALMLVFMRRGDRSPVSIAARDGGAASRTGRLLLMVAFATGCASFIYEIVWIRLLSMVLGASTHAFELMLSAFILGLALGSFWIRRRIASIRHPLAVLGLIQLAMGTLALATLMFYDFSFALMSAVMFALAKTQLGYLAFALTSHAIAMFIMLPVTICAGMTLPLITHALIEANDGERSVGRVYASNTIGAIVGVVVAVHVLIPLLNLEGALIIGAAIDLAIGALLVARWLPRADRGALLPMLSLVTGFFVFTTLFVEVDPRKMAAGVYRTGVAEIGEESDIAWRRDGKTSSVTVMHVDGSLRVLSTNGKPDASIEFDSGKRHSRDETTQILTGLLPLMAHPMPRSAAMIGIGSGQSTHALLTSPHVERVDTIEIEAAMIDGARAFLPAVAKAFDDPRSHLVVNDARTVFTTDRHRYDLIVSEPSNPWVSGVSGLFSIEFYRLVARHLAAGGIFAQWMQTYETKPELVASVFKAISSVFPAFVVYTTDNGNMLILASHDAPITEQPARLFDSPQARVLLERIGIRAPVDLMARRVGDASMLMPLMLSYAIRANSDFYPVLDLGSAEARYLDASADALLTLPYASVPLRDRFGLYPKPLEALTVAADDPAAAADGMVAAVAIHRWLGQDAAPDANRLSDELRHLAIAVASDPEDCRAPARRQSDLLRFSRAVFPYLPSPMRQAIATRIAPPNPCADLQSITRFVHALAGGDSAGLRESAAALRTAYGNYDELYAYLLECELFANLLAAEINENIALWEALEPSVRTRLAQRLPVRFLLAHSGWTEGAP